MAVPEAFAAAGDPTAYPDLGLPPWRPLKLYHSLAGDWQPGETTAFGALNADYDDAGFLRVDTDVYDTVAGRTYQEMAALAWNSHRSQAMGFVPDRGPFSSYYRLVRSLVSVPDREAGFFDGIDPTLAGVADHPTRLSDGLRDLLADAAQQALRTADEFRPAAPGRTGQQLLDIADMLRRVARKPRVGGRRRAGAPGAARAARPQTARGRAGRRAVPRAEPRVRGRARAPHAEHPRRDHRPAVERR